MGAEQITSALRYDLAFQGHTCGTPVACIVWVLSPAHV